MYSSLSIKHGFRETKAMNLTALSVIAIVLVVATLVSFVVRVDSFRRYANPEELRYDYALHAQTVFNDLCGFATLVALTLGAAMAAHELGPKDPSFILSRVFYALFVVTCVGFCLYNWEWSWKPRRA